METGWCGGHKLSLSHTDLRNQQPAANRRTVCPCWMRNVPHIAENEAMRPVEVRNGPLRRAAETPTTPGRVGVSGFGFLSVFGFRSSEFGAVLSEVKGPRAAYTFHGDELYVRAKIVSSKPKKSSSVVGETEVAWTQPLVPQASRK